MKPVPRPTDAELAILRVLWDLGPATVKVIHEALTRNREMAYTATLRTLQIMFEKGLVLRDESARAHIYRPAQQQADLQGRVVRNLVDKVFGGSAVGLVQAALHGGGVSEAEKAEIRRLLGDES